MTDEFEDFRAYVTRLRNEHHRVGEYLQRIEQQWQSLRQQSPAQGLAQILNNLQTLRAELANHFQEEEKGGCLEEAVVHQPHLSHEATRLEHEHPELLGQVDGLIDRLTSLAQFDASFQETEAAFHRFVQSLRAHEAAENRILEEGFGMPE